MTAAYWRIGAFSALLAAASCAPKQPAPRPVPPVVQQPAERALTAAAYVARAASIDLYQVQAGELAQQRAGKEATRSFGRRMMAEHRGMASQLSMAGRRLDLLPPNVLQPEQRGWLNQLAATASAEQFDATYRRQQIVAHDASYRLHYSFANDGDSPTLRLVARSAAGFELEHRSQTRSL